MQQVFRTDLILLVTALHLLALQVDSQSCILISLVGIIGSNMTFVLSIQGLNSHLFALKTAQ